MIIKICLFIQILISRAYWIDVKNSILMGQICKNTLFALESQYPQLLNVKKAITLMFCDNRVKAKVWVVALLLISLFKIVKE